MPTVRINQQPTPAPLVPTEFEISTVTAVSC